jgi:hypothetical protein
MENILQFSRYLIVGIFWGCTNPFLKYGQTLLKTESSNLVISEEDIVDVKSSESNSLAMLILKKVKKIIFFLLINFIIFIHLILMIMNH